MLPAPKLHPTRTLDWSDQISPLFAETPNYCQFRFDLTNYRMYSSPLEEYKR